VAAHGARAAAGARAPRRDAGGDFRKRSGSSFRQTLHQLGWKEGVSVRIDTRWGAGDPDRIRAYAKELIDTAPDVAVADSTPAALALQRESRTTPIVFIQAGNPVGSARSREVRDQATFQYCPVWVLGLNRAATRASRGATSFKSSRTSHRLHQLRPFDGREV